MIGVAVPATNAVNMQPAWKLYARWHGAKKTEEMLSKAQTESVEIPKFSIVWILVVQLINKPALAKNQLYQNPNIAKLGNFYRLYV